MYVTMPLLCSKEMVEIQSQTVHRAPAWPKGKRPVKKREQRNHHCGSDPESHQEDVGSMLLHLPGSQFTEEKQDRNEALSTFFKIDGNCSKPSYLAAESALDCFVPATGSMVGIQHKAKGKVVSSLRYTCP